MAKRKTKIPAKIKTGYRRKLAAAAGIFAAGSFLGASFDASSVPAYFEILTPSVTTLTDRTETPAPAETAQTLSAPQSPSDTVQEPEKAETPTPVTPPAVEVQQKPEPEPVPAPVPTPEPAPVPAPDPESVPEITPPSAAEPEPAPEPGWMDAIFVPAEQPSPVPAPEPDNWMENAASSGQAPSPAVPVSPETPSMTEELAGMLENVAVFWAPSGGKIHLDPACRSFTTVCYAGTLEEAQTVRTEGWCRLCAEHLDGTDNAVFYVKGNVCATAEQLLRSYTYSDFVNRIPASAFGG